MSNAEEKSSKASTDMLPLLRERNNEYQMGAQSCMRADIFFKTWLGHDHLS